MKNNQKLSILFWLFKAKATKKDGHAPLYARVTIDGQTEEISMKIKVNPNTWDTESKRDISSNIEAKLDSIILGGTAQQKSQKTFDLCTSFASNGAEILNLN